MRIEESMKRVDRVSFVAAGVPRPPAIVAGGKSATLSAWQPQPTRQTTCSDIVQR
jgi:hypothetical protein